MLYHLKFSPDNTSFVSGLWEMELQRRLMEYPEDRHIRFTFFHSMSLSNEISRNADTLAPLFIIAVVFLMLFSVLCNMRLVPGTLYVDWVLSKPTLAMLGVLNAGMGALTSVGFLCFIGVTYTQIIGVMPFICLSVGVNNMFILVGALQATNRAHPVEERMSEAASEAAVAITITMLTDMLSYGVGCYTAPNAVLLFCIYSGVAVTITFFYQVSFFLGLLAVSARLEESGRHCMLFFKTVSTEDYKSQSIFVKLFMLGSRPHPDSHHQKMNQPDTTMIVFFRDVFAPFLMQPIVKGVVIVWIFIYLAIATYGCINVRLGLKPMNLLVADSYARPHYAALEDYFWKYGSQLQIIVNNAPDLRDPKERANIKAMVHAFASTPHSIGDDGVQFWMDEVTYFYQHEYNTSLLDPAAYHMIEHFMELPEYETWSEDISWETDVEIGPDDVRRIKAFRFLIGLREFAETTQQMETTTMMRNLAEEYPQYNVTTFMPLWLFIDQYMQVLPNVIQDIYLAIATMIMIALLLIPQPLCALWVALAIISIDVGVIGYMTLWGVNLDAISMINLVISIGFSVDFSAHVTYGYVVSNEDNPTDRVRMALSELGWPVVQGGVSTLLGMCMLATVDAYMIVTFFKTVVLVITIGLLHALVFLPVLLSMFIRGFCLFGNDKSLSLSTLSLPKMMKKRKVKPSPIVLAPMLGNIEYPSNLLQDRYSHSARSFLEPAHLATVRSVPPSHMRYFDWPAVPASHATRSVHHASRL
uniref:SSD domain-containing protein n=1 Tax=Plectus sambesii TaxID=2011161 RepID=A0A914UIW1_9BILA